MERIMVIGSNGLLGTEVCRKLLQQDCEVIGYSSRKSSIEARGFTFYAGDLNEYGTIARIMKKHAIDVVIHNAALSHPKMAQGNSYKMFKVNLTGVLNSLEASVLTDVGRFVFISAAGVYGNNKSDPIYETAPLCSECAYDSAKIAAEEAVKNYGIDNAILRIGFIYGPGRITECPIAMLINEILDKGSVKWEHGIDQYLDYIYLSDAADGVIRAALAKNLNHKIYNLGGNRLTPYSSIVQIVEGLYPNTSIQIGNGGLGYDDIGRMDISRAQKDFGYMPRVSLEEGIEIYNKWLVSNHKK